MIIPASRMADVAPDVCVVGSGPCGLAAATRLAAKGLKVLVLESGLKHPDAEIQALSDAEIADPNRHAPMSLAVSRGLGGTSHLWGGRCIPLDPIDFERGHCGSEEGWPIREGDLSPFFANAAAFLGCGPAVFSDQSDDPGWVAAGARHGLRLDSLERWCDEPRLYRAAAVRRGPPTLTISLGLTVTFLEIVGDRVIAVKATGRDGAEFRVTAPLFVLACGGLETCRLLLNAQARQPDLFGGPQGALGRYYMGHVSGAISELALTAPTDARRFQFRDDAHSGVRRRITLAPGTLRTECLPNIAFYPDNPTMSDPGHGRGALSMIFLLLSTPGVGSRLISEAIRQMQMTARPRYAAHLANILRNLPDTATVAAGLAWQRFGRRRHKPLLFLESEEGVYPLHYHAEHLPHRESRVVLSDRDDAMGLKRIRVDLKFDAADAEGVVRAHGVLDQRLRSAGLGGLRFPDDAETRAESVVAQARDGFHQIGLARMGRHRSSAVVDENCRAFDLGNLYLAGSAVFPTSGQANPTFSAVALSLRLAEHLGSQFGAAAA